MVERTSEALNKMLFVGVTTSQSIINQIFPRWMELLKSNLILECYDIDLLADPEEYRICVNKIKTNPIIKGALVTTHKIPLYNAASDLFSELDESSNMIKEIGCIYKRNNQLLGEATDVITVKKAFNDIWFRYNYNNKGNIQVCILGCGGAGIALGFAILSSNYLNIQKILMIDNNTIRLEQARNSLSKFDSNSIIVYSKSNSVYDNDILVSSLSDNAIIVNATGLGKDLPGSPISENVVFPNGGCIWEFNYRGELLFIDIAKLQEESKDLVIEDGFNYFIHGWTTVISRVLNIKMDSSTYDILAKEARIIFNNS